jgi:hypothetical protein
LTGLNRIQMPEHENKFLQSIACMAFGMAFSNNELKHRSELSTDYATVPTSQIREVATMIPLHTLSHPLVLILSSSDVSYYPSNIALERPVNPNTTFQRGPRHPERVLHLLTRHILLSATSNVLTCHRRLFAASLRHPNAWAAQ